MTSKVLTLVIGCLCTPLWACGPDPQRVIEQVDIVASPAQVAQVLQHAEWMPRWHPQVQTVSTHASVTSTAEGAQETVRSLQLRNGWTLQETLRKHADAAVLEDSFMQGGSFPVSQYRGVIRLKVAPDQQHVTVTWTGRFNNQANQMEAPPGQDNATAVASIAAFYRSGLQGLKVFVETQALASP